ncbi:hypothetical protein DSCA_17370 [Desulfosarcina alkanivorans]|jgi:hypothetical protein|uniref:Uncharacterized protein n=1 Tax=Desulfosarcina alkanivorans TaxID=571177 RepID=A0A5K7YT40_9BACT|nr:hypothetical protein DSCA_17370 [Desulfosarcina alkanivorans]
MSANRLTLPNPIGAVSYLYVRNITLRKTINQRGDIVAEGKIQDDIEDKNEGHVDTREKKLNVTTKTNLWDVIRGLT